MLEHIATCYIIPQHFMLSTPPALLKVTTEFHTEIAHLVPSTNKIGGNGEMS